MEPDTRQPEYLTLAEAAATLPVPRCHMTLWRWSRRGVCGVRLRTEQIGRTIVTTRKWLREFGLALDAAKRRALKTPRAVVRAEVSATRRRTTVPHSRAAEELQAAGL